MHFFLLAADSLSGWLLFVQQCINGLTFGALIALIALGYTMVYGIIGLINFAHGDLFMLGCMLTLSLIGLFGLDSGSQSAGVVLVAILGLLVLTALFCATLNWTVDRLVYKPLRNAPKLAPLVSAIGVSFVFQNVGLLWKGVADLRVPAVLPKDNLLGDSALKFTIGDLGLILIVAAIMVGLTVLVKFTRLGKSMRATAQNPMAARLMGINVDRVIGATFLIGGALAGFAAVIYSLYIGTIRYDLGYMNGLYAFTAAVLGGIGNIPGAVLGGLVIGLIRSLAIGYVADQWKDPIIFGLLIVILVFRPTGLLGERSREKV
jgi:branched-chain amino acid transport system permease protein